MMRRAQQVVLLHGTIVLLIGLLCGLPYSSAITGGWGEDAVRAWRTAHLGLVLGGIWLIAIAGALHLLEIGPGATRGIVAALVSSGYGFAIALVLAAASGQRGLEPIGPWANVVAFAGNTVGAIGSLLSVGLVIWGSARALRRSSGR